MTTYVKRGNGVGGAHTDHVPGGQSPPKGGGILGDHYYVARLLVLGWVGGERSVLSDSFSCAQLCEWNATRQRLGWPFK